jgi:hypothetical protein
MDLFFCAQEDLKEASHMEADSDEEDPELIKCTKCGTMTTASAGKCGGAGCDYVFQFSSSGHLLDGFVTEDGEGDEEEEEECSDGSESEVSCSTEDSGEDGESVLDEEMYDENSDDDDVSSSPDSDFDGDDSESKCEWVVGEEPIKKSVFEPVSSSQVVSPTPVSSSQVVSPTSSSESNHSMSL